jgi:hypothetical protein
MTMLSDIPSKCAFLLAGLLLLPVSKSRSQQPAQATKPADERRAEEQAPTPHELYESARVEFSAPPPTVVSGGVQCDANGNIYVAYTTSLELVYTLARQGQELPVSKLSLDSKRVVQFAGGQFQGFTSSYGHGFYVDPRGKAYALAIAYPHEAGYKGPNWADSFIVRYKDDGTVDSVVKLEPPREEHFEAWKFAAFLDGSFLVTGFMLTDKHLPKDPFTGIFDRGGALVAPLTVPHDVRPAPPTPLPVAGSHQSSETSAAGGNPASGRPRAMHIWQTDVQQGLTAGSLDGNVYMLRASIPPRLYVISPAGEVLREIVLKSPWPGTQPIQMSLTGQDGLLLKFTPVLPMGPKSEELALLDTQSGRITDTYEMPSGAGEISACATPENEFLFLGTSKDNQLEVIKYAAR